VERRVIPPLDSLGGFAQALGWLAGKTGLSGSDLAMAPINALAGGIADGVGQLLATLGTLWIRLDVPNVWDGQTVGPTVAFLHSEVAPLVGLLAVLGIIVGACRLAWQQTAQPGVDLLEGLLVLVVVTGCGVPMIGLLASGADAWAQSIVRDALQDGDFAHNIGAMLRSQQSNVAPVLAIFFGIIALLVSAAMICLLAFRAAMLVLLAGLLPVAASLTTTQAGREYMRHYVAWVVAFIAWKPVAALIYAAAFRLIGTHGVGLGAGVGSVLIGLTLMTAAVLALPALLRFLVPATRALHAGSPAAATRHAAMRMPSGARRAVAFTHPATMAVSAGQAAATGVRHATGARQQPASVPPPEVSPPKPAPKPARRS
jgi:type IV secretion system protein TrbL